MRRIRKFVVTPSLRRRISSRFVEPLASIDGENAYDFPWGS